MRKFRKFWKTVVSPTKTINVILSLTITSIVLIVLSILLLNRPLKEEKPEVTTPTPQEFFKETIPEEDDILDNSEVENSETSELEPEESEYIEMEMYTLSELSLRQQPNYDSDEMCIVPDSEIILVKYIEGQEWVLVFYNEHSGYTKYEFLRPYDKENHINIGLEYKYQDLIRELIDSFELDVDEYFFYGMMYTENRFKQEPISSAGARGILQIMPSTWEFLYPKFCKDYPEYAQFTVDSPSDKTSNIIIGVYYIKYMKDIFGYTSVSENVDRILTSYNRGPSGAMKYYEQNGTYSSYYSREILRAADYIRKYKTWKEGL